MNKGAEEGQLKGMMGLIMEHIWELDAAINDPSDDRIMCWWGRRRPLRVYIMTRVRSGRAEGGTSGPRCVGMNVCVGGRRSTLKLGLQHKAREPSALWSPALTPPPHPPHAVPPRSTLPPPPPPPCGPAAWQGDEGEAVREKTDHAEVQTNCC
ncbi:unnamed protein product [Pleuronectes platessa]|uniref:Uncharacterized protein n=1 Tax=Pleuronectes platessa TaxID=8262 RepID=A0A9N7VXZ7_PLEPL|nr:unnamed protein product [Pleuronectes platessa]